MSLSCFKNQITHTPLNHEAEAEYLRSAASTASRKNCKEFHQIVGKVSIIQLCFHAGYKQTLSFKNRLPHFVLVSSLEQTFSASSRNHRDCTVITELRSTAVKVPI